MIVIKDTLGVYKRVYLLINREIRIFIKRRKRSIQRINIIPILIYSKVIKIGIILPRVDIPIICLAKPIHVKNTGRRRIIYISDVDTHIFESLFIN